MELFPRPEGHIDPLLITIRTCLSGNDCYIVHTRAMVGEKYITVVLQPHCLPNGQRRIPDEHITLRKEDVLEFKITDSAYDAIEYQSEMMDKYFVPNK